MKLAQSIGRLLVKARYFRAMTHGLGVAFPFASSCVHGTEVKMFLDDAGELLLPPSPYIPTFTSTRSLASASLDVQGGSEPGVEPLPEPLLEASEPQSCHTTRRDRRKQRRIPFDGKVEIWQRSPGGKADRYIAWSLNISSGGIRVIFTRILTAGEQVGVQIKRNKRALPARVAWVKPHLDGCVAGLAFTS